MPTIAADTLLSDLAPFADLGTEPPAIVVHEGKFIVRMFREGYPLELNFHPDGSIVEKYDGQERRHASFRALLASPNFADLARWADSQRLSLRERVEEETIKVVGRFSQSGMEGDVVTFDNLLWEKKPKEDFAQVAITLLDGPAGIGKTSFIRNLAYARASTYQAERRPLILHVESRGRMLQNLTDLMAFSLQTLRLRITYDQVPPLVRHGLILLAIDGFDELGDPNGYGLAWAQVNELISASRGNGNLILAGRETFVSLDRLRPVLTSLSSRDAITTFTLQPLLPTTARRWLRDKGWPEELLSSETAAPLFEVNSYALRPFFLSELARDGVAAQISEGAVTSLLPFLIEAMSIREATKFGTDVDQLTTSETRKEFIQTLMEEIARDLAENQTEAIAADTVAWLAEMCSSDIVPAALTGILKNRSGVIAFLTEDDRRGYRRFVHDQVLNYFLSMNIKRSILGGEIPKYLRRNIFGLEFLEGFLDYSFEWSQEEADAFLAQAFQRLKESGDFDRSRRNLASLIIAVACVWPSKSPILLENLSLDEVYVAQTADRIAFASVSINQLYAREADFRAITFDEHCYIVSLVADGGTLPSPSVPFPAFINLHDRTLIDNHDKALWIDGQLNRNAIQELSDDFFENVVTKLPLFELLSRVARTKTYWIKDDDEDRAARRITDDEYWNILKALMQKHELITVRSVPASGRPGAFFHVRKRQELMSAKNPPSDLVPFFKELFVVSANILKSRQS